MMNDNEIIRDFFMSRLERDGKSETLLDYTTGIRYYYQDFEVRSRKLANFLTDKAKIKKGDRLAEAYLIFFHSYPQTVCSILICSMPLSALDIL